MHSRTRIKQQILQGDDTEFLTFHSVKCIRFGQARLRNRLFSREQRFIPLLVINVRNRVKATSMSITKDRFTKDRKSTSNRCLEHLCCMKFKTYLMS
ncbi:hypothetical protein KPH14_007054 [Odynerus spinipes]|uniref:Uncharacterized protein n=1 Tax=Odynerus spinipes TaxID=1348599 RepID=A0AAD9RT19_9HYME|nr:hypothetical protein KPH14_007054 [Odynerus spinipes]